MAVVGSRSIRGGTSDSKEVARFKLFCGKLGGFLVSNYDLSVQFLAKVQFREFCD